MAHFLPGVKKPTPEMARGDAFSTSASPRIHADVSSHAPVPLSLLAGLGTRRRSGWYLPSLAVSKQI